ncbi:MAG TPA: potassium-transporting ATPase subunit F [Rectinemataceae bacterium]|nr:potassium-transporting ATPase subunit F [Rectinemataceae bacterium]
MSAIVFRAALLLSVALLCYLGWAMFRPERF